MSKNMQNKLFKPDSTKKLFTITIDVFENCCMLQVGKGDPSAPDDINYHHVIGALETQKHHLMTMQREENIKQTKRKK